MIKVSDRDLAHSCPQLGDERPKVIKLLRKGSLLSFVFSVFVMAILSIVILLMAATLMPVLPALIFSAMGAWINFMAIREVLDFFRSTAKRESRSLAAERDSLQWAMSPL